MPALDIWSDRDARSTGPPPNRRKRYVTRPFRYAQLRGVSHRISEEAPDAAELVLDHIARAA